MICPKCGDTDTFIFMKERIPCIHCHTNTEISYIVCQSCMNIWRVVDGEPLEEEYMINNINSKDEDGEDLDNELETVSLEELEKVLSKKNKVMSTQDRNTMTEMFHRCLRCEHIAYEISPHCFQCPECGFEWEVI